MKEKADTRGKRPVRVKKIATLKDTPPRGQRMKNPNTSPPYSTLSLEYDTDDKNKEIQGDKGVEGDIESSSEEVSSEQTNDATEENVTPIDVNHLTLAIKPCLVLIVEWWGTPVCKTCTIMG